MSRVPFLHSDQRETAHVGDGAEAATESRDALVFFFLFSEGVGRQKPFLHVYLPCCWGILTIGLGLGEGDPPVAPRSPETKVVSCDCHLLLSS